MSLSLLEVVDTVSPCTAGFGMEGGRKAVCIYLIKGVDTTLPAIVATGSQAVTPASMDGIYVGQQLTIGVSGAFQEVVVVTAVTGTTFTADFTFVHGVGSPCVGFLESIDLQNVISQVLGQTLLTSLTTHLPSPSTNGTIQRTPPLSHPVWPWLYAESISNITGFGSPYTKQASPGLLDVPAVPFYTQYPAYKLTVEFTNRPYTVMTDDEVDLVLMPHAYDIGGTDHTGITVAYEWERYTDFTLSPTADSVTMQVGCMAFNTSGTANGRLYNAMPRLFLPDSVLTYTWYGVPYRFISSANSYINSSLRGRVNQDYWPPDSLWVSSSGLHGSQGFPPGSLLYQNFKPIRYTPPVPNDPAITIYNVENSKLCNIEFTFMLTSRSAPTGETTAGAVATTLTSNAPVGNWIVSVASITNITIGCLLLIDTGTNSEVVFVTAVSGSTFTAKFTQSHSPGATVSFVSPTNGNYIHAGWNLDPWAGDRRFHYSQTVPSVGAFTLPGGLPEFYSFPFALLFQDPDSASVAGLYPTNS